MFWSGNDRWYFFSACKLTSIRNTIKQPMTLMKCHLQSRNFRVKAINFFFTLRFIYWTEDSIIRKTEHFCPLDRVIHVSFNEIFALIAIYQPIVATTCPLASQGNQIVFSKITTLYKSNNPHCSRTLRFDSACTCSYSTSDWITCKLITFHQTDIYVDVSLTNFIALFYSTLWQCIQPIYTRTV